jgi:ABC-type sugar transport system permease subunit
MAAGQSIAPSMTPGSATPSGSLSDPRRTSWPVLAIFVVPAITIYIGLTAYPAFRTFYDSFFTIEGLDATYVGLANYRELMADETFWIAARNTFIWAFVAPVLDVATGLLLALALYAGVPFARFLRVAWFTPVLLSYVVVAILWMWIYNYDWGILNALLRAIGLGDLASSWLGNPNLALASVIVTHAWKWAGFNMVVCLAAIHSLPREVLEAADLDNCGWAAKLRYIIIPMLRPTLLSLYVLAFIGKMKVFDLVWIMTQGGPLWATETVSTYVYKRAFNWNTFDLGYPSAIAAVWFGVVCASVLVLNRLFASRERLEF